ncbi:MAG: S46 family peptidase [Bacteroides sp.]|nr:S46 family peptidase [Bacteroides sp.]
MKKLLLLLIFLPLYVWGSEGMWLPCCLSKQTQQVMKEMGLKLSPDQLYNPVGGALTNAVVSFGGFCSGVVVSPDGLVFTNHHCGFDAIQQHSSVEHDYLRDGFVADSLNKELPNPDLFVSFLVRTEDVTERVLKALPAGVEEGERELIVDSISTLITQEAIANDTLLRAEITPFYAGNEYYLSVYKDYYDVRLVFAPPSSVGKFGGDTDNWVWPRHTGDFSVFRIYADKDNRPAAYSPENVPYHPDYFAPVSLGGYEQGSFCMTMGYPGSTSRYLSSFGIEERVNTDNAAMIDVRTIKQAIWKDAMEKSDDIRIKYASKYAQSSNYWKNSIGMNQAVKELKVIEKKQALEKQLQEWIRRKPDERGKYAQVLTELELNYRNRRSAARAMAYFGESFANGPELITAALAVLNFDFEAEETELERNMRQLLEVYANMDLDVDKQVFVAMLKEYAAEVEKEYLPEIYSLIDKKFKGNYQAFVDDLYERSALKTPRGFEQVVKGDSTYVLFEDPAASFAIDMLVKFYEFNNSVEDASMKIQQNERLLNEAVREMEADKDFYPDANSTMRLSFGMVGGYSPKDAIEYTYYTTTKGIFDKIRQYKGDSDFDVLSSVVDLLKRKDFGRYAAKDGDMNVCFISDNDITGGNSGSGMFNGEGELIGLAFDGNWEAMSGDLVFEPNLQRCIGVDIRYVLYMIETYGKASRLVDELKITPAVGAD